jgi:hypothetical protein
MTTAVKDWRLRQLREALEHLSAPAADQAAYLQSIGTAPLADELALEHYDAALAVWDMVDRGELPESIGTTVREVDSLLDEMSGQEKADLWDVSALENLQWDRVRALARKALVELDRSLIGSP